MCGERKLILRAFKFFGNLSVPVRGLRASGALKVVGLGLSLLLCFRLWV